MLSELQGEYGSNISYIVSEYFAEVLSGEADIDSTWYEYLNKLKETGYGEILEELQKAHLYEDLMKLN
ncbi:MAG: hypothetical protein GX754_06245 [Clostridiaceae bacterium]|nr:hypothetical protein [Clostridiaceae bacterium]